MAARRCDVCWRNIDRDPWPHWGVPCGHCDAYTMTQQGESERVIALARGIRL